MLKTILGRLLVVLILVIVPSLVFGKQMWHVLINNPNSNNGVPQVFKFGTIVEACNFSNDSINANNPYPENEHVITSIDRIELHYAICNTNWIRKSTGYIIASDGIPTVWACDIPGVQYSHIFNSPIYDPYTTECPVTPGICPALGATTNPIFPATGEKIKLQTDYTDNAPHGLDFTRYYRTSWVSDIQHVGMGKYWNHRFGMQLIGVDPLERVVQMADGSQRNFWRSIINTPWIAVDGGGDSLVETVVGNTPLALFTNAQTDEKWQFNALGKPVTLTQRNGWAYSLVYNASGQLATVTNKFGRALTFTYGATGSATAGLLTGVAAPDGQAISYQYNSEKSLIYVGYGTNASQNTSSIQYLYENPAFPKALTGMVDENGTRSATYAYDAQGRAVSSELAGGADKYQVSYGSSTAAGALNTSATITDPLGTARNYTYSNTAGSLAVTGANVTSNGQMPGADAASRVQNAQGLIDSETDYLGVQTMFTWDATRKLPLSTTRAAGRPEAQTTNTTWHPTLRLPTSVIETGRTTNYTYDAVGNRLSQSIVDTVTNHRLDLQHTRFGGD
jgi:YD repeat-containing protein